jgi:hypothetical protein
MALNGISTLMIPSGTTLTKNVSPPHSNTEIVAPFSAIWSLNYAGALGATNNVSYKLYVTSLGIGSAFTLTSHQTGDYAVTAGNFLYDEYGTSIGIIKGNTTIDNYMAKAAAVCGSLSNTIITAAAYKGTWNAFSDTPTLIDGVGTLGDAYDVDTAGTSGAYPAYGQQDWRIYDGSAWVRVDKTTTTQWTITPAASGLADKEARQKAKLDLASSDRLAVSNTRVYYDITQLPTQYSGNDIVDNPNTDGLVEGRPWITSRVYTGLTFTYGQATISFTLTNGVFSNITCPYGAGGYSASSGQLTMPGNQLIGGTSPANDIVWNYVCAANNGVITGFTYSSGNPWTGSYSIVTSGQLLYIDAGDTSSYSGSGTTWTDLSTYQNDATLTGSPTFTDVGSASYFSFNGSTQYAPVTTSKMNVTYTGKTTMFAIRTVNANTGNAIYRNLFGGNTAARNFNTYMYHVSGTTWQIQFSTGPFPWVGPASASFTVTDNEWIVVAVTQTIGGVLTYYVNGQQIGTPATGVTFSQFINSGIEAVARSDNYWRGDIGSVAIYGQALNAIQIQQNFNALRGRYGL